VKTNRPSTPVLHHSNLARSEAWLISSMCHVPSVTTNLWLARNFFVCLRLTVIVLIAVMNFRWALPPAKRPKRRINALDHDTASGQGISRNKIPLYHPEAVKKIKSPCSPPFLKGEMLKRKSTTVHRKYSIIPLIRVRVPLFGKEGSGEICGVPSGPLQFFHSSPFSKERETQCVSGFTSARQIPLFEKACPECSRREGLGEICVRNATESSQRDRLRRKGNFASHLGGIHVNHYVSKEIKAP
jgi:hypothetical protein